MRCPSAKPRGQYRPGYLETTGNGPPNPVPGTHYSRRGGFDAFFCDHFVIKTVEDRAELIFFQKEMNGNTTFFIRFTNPQDAMTDKKQVFDNQIGLVRNFPFLYDLYAKAFSINA
jgi:hypothetical protein